ncbi:hypothetical protein LIER_38531 [Lithospermum erythrorhizon]|uniref:Uncharacterized protein n=1 Tax=Lithospermum erythrorhizon TaxID=34254 RepID=A0AAV3Q5D0_LITER
MIWLIYALREMGLTGICFLFYKKPITSLDDGLGVKEIGMFVTHPSRKVAKSLLLGEIYADLRSKWPKPTLKEIDDNEARLLGFKEGCDRGVEKVHVEVEGGQSMEDVKVEVGGVSEDGGCRSGCSGGGDDGSSGGGENRLSQYNFGEDYESMEEAEMESETHEAYTKTEGLTLRQRK